MSAQGQFSDAESDHGDQVTSLCHSVQSLGQQPESIQKVVPLENIKQDEVIQSDGVEAAGQFCDHEDDYYNEDEDDYSEDDFSDYEDYRVSVGGAGGNKAAFRNNMTR